MEGVEYMAFGDTELRRRRCMKKILYTTFFAMIMVLTLSVLECHATDYSGNCNGLPWHIYSNSEQLVITIPDSKTYSIPDSNSEGGPWKSYESKFKHVVFLMRTVGN